MNKRIYYNNYFVEFVPNSQLNQNQNIINASALNNEVLKELLQKFINDSTNSLFFYENDFSVIMECFRSFCKYIKAAGGFISQNEKWLCIHRLNRWDLPKGKLEKGEIITQAAIRECEEECGIKELKIERALPSTFHIYAYKTGFAIKQTFWFHISSTYDKPLVPQIEEDIFEVKWFTKEEIQTIVLKDTYFTIQQVIEEMINEKF